MQWEMGLAEKGDLMVWSDLGLEIRGRSHAVRWNDLLGIKCFSIPGSV